MNTQVVSLAAALLVSLPLSVRLEAQDNEKESLAQYRATALKGGNAERGAAVFKSKQAACTKCHVVSGNERKAGPGLGTVGDKFERDQLIKSVLEPSARIHPDHATTTVVTTDGKVINGVVQSRNKDAVLLLDAEGKPVRIPVGMIEKQKPNRTSLMPTGLYKTIKADEFANLIAYLGTLRQNIGKSAWPGMPDEMPMVSQPARLERLHSADLKFDHPVCIIASPVADDEFFVVEQKTRRIWRLQKGDGDGTSRAQDDKS